MSTRIRVSVVTPFLDAERFIAESIESVLAQTRDDWELLLVDDGSTDGSSAIAREYAARHPDRIRYLAHPDRRNRGASASRNLGGAHASGEYLAYLDADDVYLPGKLAHQIPLLERHPEVGMVYAATEYWHSWTKRPEDVSRDWVWRKYGVDPGVAIAPPRMLITFLEDGGTVPCMGSVLVRRELVNRVGGWEESFRAVYTDQVFHAKIALHAPVLISDGCWDRYRQHGDSSCHAAARTGELQSACTRYLEWLAAYLRRESAAEPLLWHALARARRSHASRERLARVRRWQRRAWRVAESLRCRIAALGEPRPDGQRER